jgi:hypothetical protein
LREEQSPNFDWDVGDLVWLGSGAESDDLNDERWHKVKAHDPLGSAFTLPYLQSVERLPSGLYRVTFVESQGNTYFAPRPRFAIVDVARCAVSLTPNTPHAYSHAALYAALGYHALHETAEPTVYSRDLAATWYWFEETGEAISSARLLALAAAAIQVLRLRGGSVEINPEDLLLLSAPTDAPSPESVTRLVGGDNSAYAQVWNEYLTLLKESSLTLTSESPEFDLEQLWRYENALAVYDVARSVREIESARVVLYQNLLNTHPPALSDERLSVVAGETAETLQNEPHLSLDRCRASC